MSFKIISILSSKLPWLFLFLFSPFLNFSQLAINEVCSSNSLTLDAFGETADWIELKNIGSETIETEDYYLSDDLDNPEMWELPEIELAPGEIVLFFGESQGEDEFHFNFNISSSGEIIYLHSEDENLIQSLVIPSLRNEDSFGLGADGLSYKYFSTTTPDQENDLEEFLGYTDNLQLSLVGGIYDEGLQVSLISNNENATIYYSTDGSFPTVNSTIYEETIAIETTVVLKAIALEDGYLPSIIQSDTYIINENYHLPIISISVDHDSLFDPIVGIHELGPNADSEWPFFGANYWEDRGLQVHFEFYENGIKALDQDLELKIHGGKSSRNKPQKPFRLTARKKYDNEFIEYEFFEEKPGVDKFKSIVLRNSGSDFLYSNFRDGMWHQFALWEGLNIDVFGFKPCVVLLNGEYWGIMNIREKVNEQYFAGNHGVNPDSVIVSEKENTPFIGDTIAFFNFKEYVVNEDLSLAEKFEYVESQLDIESYKDYFAFEIFSGNLDWPANNIKFWKPSFSEGKWRYILFDLDTTAELYGWLNAEVDLIDWIYGEKKWALNSQVFINLAENEEFKRTFINRLADLMNTSLTPDNLIGHVETIVENLEPEMENHMERWNGNFSLWHEEVEEVIPNFFRERTGNVQSHVVQNFGLEKVVELEFSVYPENAGTIQINTVHPELPFNGDYFSGNAIDIEAIANEGQKFLRWDYSQDYISSSQNLQYDFKYSGTVTAIFEDSIENEFGILNNLPQNGMLNCVYNANESGIYSIKIFTLDGQLLQEEKVLVQSGKNVIDLELKPLQSALYFVQLSNSNHQENAKFVIP